MKDQREIYEALLAGETLIKKHLFTVKMKEEGMLESSQDESKGCRALFNTIFADPEKWKVFKVDKWYENIPDGGVLCWVNNGHVETIIKYKNFGFINDYENFREDATPLTKQEIQVFMENAPETP